MIDFTSQSVHAIRPIWSWTSEYGGDPPAPATAAVFEFVQWFGDVIGFNGWSWVSEAGGTAPVSAADDYIVRSRHRGRR